MAQRSPSRRASGRTAPRLGRPPAGDSAVTRERILETARRSFAERGYEAATNKSLATDAGVTSGALYHYFQSKLDIYAAVLEEVQAVVYARFEAATEDVDTFLGALEATLDAARALNAEDPTLAQFLGAVRVDVRRHPELDEVYEPSGDLRQRFFDNLIDIGIRTGEIDAVDRDRVASLVRTMMVGLVDAVSDDPERHGEAIDGLKLLLEGKLIRPPV